VSKGLKYVFFAHAIVAFIFAIGFLFVPDMIADWMGFTSFSPVALARLQGASMLAIAVSSWLGYRASEPQQVRIVVIMEIWLTIVSALVALYGILFDKAPTTLWINVAIFVIFAILRIAYYPRVAKAPPKK
jgi:drug/metabolite transporter (DMT)-like permease